MERMFLPLGGWRRTAARAVVLSLIGLCALAIPALAGDLSLDVDEGEMVRLPRPAANVFVANPEIADIQAPQPRTLLVVGKKAGRTTVIALDSEGSDIGRYTIIVSPGLSALRDRLSRDYAGLDLHVEGTPTSVIVTGKVDNPEQARGIVELAQAYVPEQQKVVNRMNLASDVQVQLRVMIAEVSRSVTQQFGANWRAVFSTKRATAGLQTGRDPTVIDPSATAEALFGGAVIGNWSINAVIQALAQRGQATLLAEPSMTTISGQAASFLAGGEIPVVMSSGLNGNSVTYKEYGTRLYFTPTVLSHDRINLHVRPEVSQLTDVGAVEVSGLTIPALATRRVETSVELGSGDSFVIGGLLQTERNARRSGIPGVSDIPLLGRLFQSKETGTDERELLMIVTPYIVRPMQANDVALPNKGTNATTNLDRLLTGRTGQGDGPPPPAVLTGRAGFAF